MTDDNDATEIAPTPHGKPRIGAYELVRQVGQGGMGTVWEGRHITLGRRVAVKLLKPEFVRNPEVLARFIREGMAAARIEHPHVATVFDVGQQGERAFLVMEYLDGEDLGAVFDREPRLDPVRSVDLLLPVLAAVAAAHAEGVVHRDLKPGNIFLARDRNGVMVPKVVDFGLAKITAPEASVDDLTRPETAMGTLSYMPIEQVRSSREADPRWDQYALGVTLYRCVTGRLPYTGRNQMETFRALAQGVCPRPSELVPTLPPGLDDVILRAMHRTPESRFASVLAFGAALLPYASSTERARWEPTFKAHADPAWARPAAQPATAPSGIAPARHRAVAVAAFVVLVLAVLGLLVAWLASR